MGCVAVGAVERPAVVLLAVLVELEVDVQPNLRHCQLDCDSSVPVSLYGLPLEVDNSLLDLRVEDHVDASSRSGVHRDIGCRRHAERRCFACRDFGCHSSYHHPAERCICGSHPLEYRVVGRGVAGHGVAGRRKGDPRFARSGDPCRTQVVFGVANGSC